VSTPRPGHFTSGKETQYPLYRRLGGPGGVCRGAENFRPHSCSNPGPSSPQPVIPTTHSRPLLLLLLLLLVVVVVVVVVAVVVLIFI